MEDSGGDALPLLAWSMCRATRRAALLAVSALLSAAPPAAGLRDSSEDSASIEAGAAREAEIHRHAAASDRRGTCAAARCNSGEGNRSYFKGGQEKFAKFSNCKVLAVEEQGVSHPVSQGPMPRPDHLSLADAKVCREECDIAVEVQGVAKGTSYFFGFQERGVLKATASFPGALVWRSHPFYEHASTCEPNFDLLELGDVGELFAEAS